MNVPQYAAAAAKLLRRLVPMAQTIAGDRQRGIATLERAMRARARRRSLWLGAALAAAASIPLAVGLVRGTQTSGDVGTQVSILGSPAGRGAALRTGQRALPLVERAQLSAGQHIETPQAGGASLKLSTGTEIDLLDSTSFRVDSQGTTEHFTLERGGLSARVAKLESGQRFIVATPDAEIEVRGTRFRVQVLRDGEICGAGSRSRLEVSEGVVEVRASGKTTSVAAGQRWPADCSQTSTELTQTGPNDSSAQPASALQRTRGVALASGVLAAGGGHEASIDRPRLSGSTRRAADPSSGLTEVNDLFAEGLALRRQGDSEGALRTYQSLIVRFPTSPLAENALVERMRVLAGKRDPRARREAELYLTRYPRGFAANEARLLTVAP